MKEQLMMMINNNKIYGVLLWVFIAIILWTIRPKSLLNSINNNKLLSCFALLFTIIICVLPMSLSPWHNGENPGHRNQYELLANSIIDGHINIEYDDIDPKLELMENPYDPIARKEGKVSFHPDHAYYKGKYYVYFGVVPVILLFIPYRIITGSDLLTYHATQVFVALTIISLYLLFRSIKNKFFENMPLSIHLLLFVSISFMSVWNSVAGSSIYGCAIAAGLCMEVWSYFFYIKTIWVEDVKYYRLFLGALFGALAFGCRPNIALANIILKPVFLELYKKYKFKKELIKSIITIMIPYVIIGALLMIYNYLRFENIFEFGQTYQLTLWDQTIYKNVFSFISVDFILKQMYEYFIKPVKIINDSPYIVYGGLFANYPLLLSLFVLLMFKKFRKSINGINMTRLIRTMFIAPIIISLFSVIFAPVVLERYHMDTYWFYGILLYIFVGTLYRSNKIVNNSFLTSVICVLLLVMTISSVVYYLTPIEASYTLTYPEVLEKIVNTILLR